MEKYSVLFLIIIYFVAAGLTSVLFYPQYGTVDTIMGASQHTFSTGTDFGGVSTFWRFLQGGLAMQIPGVPSIVGVFLMVPMYIMIAYFIFLNLPDITILGFHIGTKQP